jgi:hypothetical protein
VNWYLVSTYSSFHADSYEYEVEAATAEDALTIMRIKLENGVLVSKEGKLVPTESVRKVLALKNPEANINDFAREHKREVVRAV